MPRRIENGLTYIRKHGIGSFLAEMIRRSSFIGKLITTVVNVISRVGISERLLSFSPVGISQLQPARAEVMAKIFANRFKSSIQALEVGTWFGKGSTRIWLEQLPHGSDLFLVDSWREYLKKEDLAEKSSATLRYRLMDDVHHIAINSTLKEIYKWEKKRPDLNIHLLRGKSTDILKHIESGSFDFIYIDGSHYYSDVKSDIANAKRLLRKDFAILCGDDYEKLPTPDLLASAKKNLNSDILRLDDGTSYHPGVMLAIDEELGEVNMKDGFWWVYVHDGQLRKSVEDVRRGDLTQ